MAEQEPKPCYEPAVVVPSRLLSRKHFGDQLDGDLSSSSASLQL